jgi:hypothetical protein
MLYSLQRISGGMGMGMGMQGGRGGGFNTGFNNGGGNMQGHFNPAFMQGDGQFDPRKRFRMDGGG